MTTFAPLFAIALLLTTLTVSASAAGTGDGLDPRGQIHIPIGLANTLDTLKTYVEAEGNFSPGFGSYGVYFWVYNSDAKTLTAPTMPGVESKHGLPGAGQMMPWTTWNAGAVAVKTEVCEVRQTAPEGDVYVDGAYAHLTNAGKAAQKISLFVALRPLGAAGWPVHDLAVSPDGKALLVDGHPALVAQGSPSGAGVVGTDTVGALALTGALPGSTMAHSASGDCSGAMRFDLTLEPGQTRGVGFVCPVLPGRRAVGHRWDGTSEWAQTDLADPNPREGGLLQPDPGLDYYESLSPERLFPQAAAYWNAVTGQVSLSLPDPRWAECFGAVVGHVALAMNDDAPDVAAINYNVYNRDGVYAANILQKSGDTDLASRAIDYFLAHPFNGRSYPEADNPGQLLWVLGEHWQITRSAAWLKRVYPSVQKLAALIRYLRTTPTPHYVNKDSLDFGDALPANQRQELKPGACDGFHPEYTEAFDIAGLRAAALLAQTRGQGDQARDWRSLADALTVQYDTQFGANLPHDYGSYSVLWPCRLYPLDSGPGHDQFQNIGAQMPTGWRYFPLATAHQGLLAGNREAGWGTVNAHLAHPQMQGWYAFDEGGDSGQGNWPKVRTRWNPSVAMPHGWAVAEMFLLLRDSLVFEDEGRLVLLPGVPPDWFRDKHGLSIDNLPTHFGALSLAYALTRSGATLTLSGAAPPNGYLLRLPPALGAKCTVNGKPVPAQANGDVLLPGGTVEVRLGF